MTTLIHLDNHQLPTLAPTVMAVGNFDGVHLGHQKMVSDVKTLADRYGYQSAVMIFEPQPKELFAPHIAPARLSNLHEKSDRLAKLGVDMVLVVDFNHRFASLSADDFCQLLHRLGVQQLVLGADFRFGAARMGDWQLLGQAGFRVHLVDDVMQGGERVSSTRVRKALAQGKLALAKSLLGDDYRMIGQVVHGDKLGRTIGFPTANIELARLRPAVQGIYGVDVRLLDGRDDFTHQGIAGLRPESLFGCASIGTRPSVNGQAYRFEVFLPNFEGDLYGCYVDVAFYHFLHQEYHYPNLDALQQGIASDVEALIAWRHS